MSYHFTKGRSNDLVISLIGLIDIISGIVIYVSRNFNLTSNSSVSMLMFFYFFLGIWSLARSFRRRKYFDWRAIIDIINAVCMTLIYYGNVYEIFQIIGAIIAIKGIIGIFLITTKE
ncbi:MAG: hypothetical protein NTW30_02265 [Candidatus Aenigmarchaeota archaeon]|nr:hypothetical protein [Candidatus Aenigmarchaeota archaeon]